MFYKKTLDTLAYGSIRFLTISQFIFYIQYLNYGILLLMTVNNLYKLEIKHYIC